VNLFELDKSLFLLINHGASNAFFDAIMPFITKKGYLLLIPYVFYLFFRAYSGHKTKEDSGLNINIILWSFFLAVLAFLLSNWLGNEIKHIVKRIRPCNVLEDVRLLSECSKSFSMPSNHAANMFGAAAVLYYFNRRYIHLLAGIYPFIIASLVAFSRVYVGVHYPMDVLAGACLGFFNAFLVIGLLRIAESRYKKEPSTTLLFSFPFVISVFRIYYILHGPIDLSSDEAHYWEWSRRLDLSYYSKGPMIAYLIYIGTSLFGDNVFGIRIMAVIFSAFSSLFLFKLANLMYDRQNNNAIAQQNPQANSPKPDSLIALSSAILLQIIPMFAPFGVIFTIDSPFIFFWIFSLYLFWKAIISENSRNWLFLGISIGGRPLLLLGAFLIIVGVQFIGMGLLGEMLMMIYHESQEKPIYAIKKILSFNKNTE